MTQLLKYVQLSESFNWSQNYTGKRKWTSACRTCGGAYDQRVTSSHMQSVHIPFWGYPGSTPSALLWRAQPRSGRISAWNVQYRTLLAVIPSGRAILLPQIIILKMYYTRWRGITRHFLRTFSPSRFVHPLYAIQLVR
jgi:hypothetical protein